MGLKEKQAIVNLDFSFLERGLLEVTGKRIRIKLHEQSFTNDLNAIFLADTRGAQKVAAGISRFCSNVIGKEAFNEKNITKVLLKNQPAGKKSITIEKGVLVVACAFASSGDFFADSEITAYLENLL